MTGTLLVRPATMMYIVKSMAYATRRFGDAFRGQEHTDDWNIVGNPEVQCHVQGPEKL